MGMIGPGRIDRLLQAVLERPHLVVFRQGVEMGVGMGGSRLVRQ